MPWRERLVEALIVRYRSNVDARSRCVCVACLAAEEEAAAAGSSSPAATDAVGGDGGELTSAGPHAHQNMRSGSAAPSTGLSRRVHERPPPPINGNECRHHRATTPLLASTERGLTAITALLIRHGADVSAATEDPPSFVAPPTAAARRAMRRAERHQWVGRARAQRRRLGGNAGAAHDGWGGEEGALLADGNAAATGGAAVLRPPGHGARTAAALPTHVDGAAAAATPTPIPTPAPPLPLPRHHVPNPYALADTSSDGGDGEEDEEEGLGWMVAAADVHDNAEAADNNGDGAQQHRFGGPHCPRRYVPLFSVRQHDPFSATSTLAVRHAPRQTALHLVARWRDDAPVAGLLADFGADVTARDGDGRTPARLARRRPEGLGSGGAMGIGADRFGAARDPPEDRVWRLLLSEGGTNAA